jgi:hypothetical protein
MKLFIYMSGDYIKIEVSVKYAVKNEEDQNYQLPII